MFDRYAPRRYSFARFVLLSLSFSLWLAGCSAAPLSGPTTLNILVWEGYAEKDWIQPFEQAHNVSVKITYVSSADDMFAKARAASPGFDLMTFDSSLYTRYVQQNLIRPIDETQITHYTELNPTLVQKWEQQVRIDGRLYGVPFTTGSLPLLVNRDKVKQPIDSWAVLWDPAFKGQIITQDDVNNQITMAAIYLGFPDPFNLNDSELELIKSTLIIQKKVLRTYYAGVEDGVDIMSKGDAAICYSMGSPITLGLLKRGVNVEEVIPKEGAILWIDGLALGKDTQHPELVYALINHLVSPEVQAQVVAKTGYSGTSLSAAKYMSASDLKLSHMDDPEYWKRLVLLAPIQDSWEKRVAVWNAVKAATAN